MEQEFTFEVCPGYVRVQTKPEFKITLESTTRLWSQLQTFCQPHSYQRVLCEGVRPTRDMTLQDMYECAKVAAQMLFGFHVAFSWEGYQTDKLTGIFKIAAQSRGVNFGFFEDRAKALAWLGFPEKTGTVPCADQHR
jgi:hypothetical protein